MSAPIYADTSFLFSVYAANEHSRNALRILRRLSEPLSITIISQFELETAMRLREFTRDLTAGQSERYLDRFSEDVSGGQMRIEQVDLHSLFARARRLSAKHVLTLGVRSFDILHVASALELQAESFLTFDRLQQKLAIAEGLKTPW
jgi:predicted nucleic acid-binding protein